jgi:hypothetical protein
MLDLPLTSTYTVTTTSNGESSTCSGGMGPSPHHGEGSGALVALVVLEPNEANAAPKLPPPPSLQESRGPILDMEANGYNPPPVPITSKETEAWFVNIPMKPPPPRTGLLGTIPAHERRCEGGLGATPTEQERERLTEEGQLTLNDPQKRQPDMVQIGSMCGSQLCSGSPAYITPSGCEDDVSQDSDPRDGKHGSSCMPPTQELTESQAQQAAYRAAVPRPKNNGGANEKTEGVARRDSLAESTLAPVDPVKTSVSENDTLFAPPSPFFAKR